jgi:hypothetical protein
MDVEKFSITTTGEKVILLEGTYEHPIRPIAINYKGTIDAPLRFLEKRKDVNLLKSVLLIDREKMEIKLILNESDKELKSSVIGEIEMVSDFTKWKINTGQSWDPISLGQFIKMNRGNFESRETAMNLYPKLRDFQAKINGECTQKAGDKNDSYEIMKRKAVDHNLPGGFTLFIPIFKGTGKKPLNVEIEVNPDSLQCYLISPDANEEIQEFKDSCIDIQKKAIAELCPDLVIIEQ